MKYLQIQVPMTIDVDGAPNAYGPNDKQALDYEANAHVDADKKKPIVGYLTKNDDGKTPIAQKAGDPFPGFYISTTAFNDPKNSRKTDPRRYVNAAEINYVVIAKKAAQAGVKQGDFVVVHSMRTKQTVYGIVGDSGHSSGAEGSLALLQRLGYPFKSGKTGSVDEPEIIVRYFPGSNPKRHFFSKQSDLDTEAAGLGLDTSFAVPAGLPVLAMMAPMSSASLIPAAASADTAGHGSSNVNNKPVIKKFIQSPNHSSRNGARITMIVLHCTETTLAKTFSTFQQAGGDNPVSAHYVIDQNGDIYQMVRDSDRAWHCMGANSNSIGIEHVAAKSDAIRAEQTNASAKLIRWLLAEYDIPRQSIYGHNFAPGYNRPGGTSCPDKLFGAAHTQQTVTEWVARNV